MSLSRIITSSCKFVSCFFLYISLAHAQGFDENGGIITTDVGSEDDYGNSISVLPDGKILVSGFAYSDAFDRPDFAIVRYYANGNIDTSFGTNGIVITDFAVSFDLSYELAVQPDSKIVLVGSSTVNNSDVALARYHPDGTFDASFGAGNGMVTSDIAAGSDSASSIAILSDGKMLVAGEHNADFLLRKYLSDGSVDSGFSGGLGFVTTHLQPGGFDYASAMIVQSDDKIILVGSSEVNLGGNEDIALVRYNSDGTLDTNFNTTGIVIQDVLGDDDSLSDIILQSDEKIVVVGSYTDGSTGLLVARYNTDGTLDTSFAMGGLALINMDGSHEYGTAVVIQPDGKILVGGYGGFNNSGGDGGEYFLVRLNSDGSLDSSFGDGDGMSVVDIGGDSDVLRDIALLSDDKILAVGNMSKNIVDVEFALVRFKSDGTLDAPDDSTEDADGGTTTNITSDGGSIHIALLLIFILMLINLRNRRY